MNPYQQNALQYFRERGVEFIYWMSARNMSPVVIIDDLVPYSVEFLDGELKRELSLYTKESKRYGYLIDMLIEIHIVAAEDRFCRVLNRAAQEVFLKDPAS